MNNKDTLIKQTITDRIAQIGEIAKQTRSELQGREVKILSNWNGQPYGHSKKSLQGEKFIVKDASVDGERCWLWDGNFDHCSIELDEVEFL